MRAEINRARLLKTKQLTRLVVGCALPLTTTEVATLKSAVLRHFGPVTQEINLIAILTGLRGAVEKTRTSTPFRAQPPQGCASTNSATTAREDRRATGWLAGVGA